MGWAKNYIQGLKNGDTVRFRPRGNSMLPLIRSGQLCTVAPVDQEDLQEGDIVLCTVHGKDYLHIISAVDKPSGRYQIRNNKGHTNGWTKSVHGRLVSIV